MLDNVVALSCNNFEDECITEDMFVEPKVLRLGKKT